MQCFRACNALSAVQKMLDVVQEASKKVQCVEKNIWWCSTCWKKIWCRKIFLQCSTRWKKNTFPSISQCEKHVFDCFTSWKTFFRMFHKLKNTFPIFHNVKNTLLEKAHFRLFYMLKNIFSTVLQVEKLFFDCFTGWKTL